MADTSPSALEQRPGEGADPYEPPRIETILTEEQLEREVLYAGGTSQAHV